MANSSQQSDIIPGVDEFWRRGYRSILTNEDLQEGNFQAVMEREVRLSSKLQYSIFNFFIFQGPTLDVFPLVKFHTNMAIPSWNDIVNPISQMEMEVSHKRLCKTTGGHLTSRVKEIGKETKKLCDYYNSDKSEGTFEEFLYLNHSRNLEYYYIENAEYPNLRMQDLDVKWKWSEENYINNRLYGVPGVTKETLYCGSKFATFPWHKEDGDLRSLSLLIAGSDKVN